MRPRTTTPGTDAIAAGLRAAWAFGLRLDARLAATLRRVRRGLEILCFFFRAAAFLPAVARLGIGLLAFIVLHQTDRHIGKTAPSSCANSVEGKPREGSLALCDRVASKKWHNTGLKRESGSVSELGH